MSTYYYKAVDKIGRPARGSLDAVNEIDLELRLRHMGLDLITVRDGGKRRHRFGRGVITRQDIITFCFHMEQITRAGIPLLEGLVALRDSIDNLRFREVMTSILEDMEGGKQFSQALATHPGVFDPLFSSLVRAGEQTGKLTEVFENLGNTLKWQDELLEQAKRLLIYPAVVSVAIMVVILFLMLYLVPQLVGFLRGIGQELPWQTRVLIFLSEAFVDYWWLVLGVPVAVMVALLIWIRSSGRARYLMDYFKLQIPLLGPILTKIILARFASYFALMYQSGITILEALKVCEDIAGNRVVADGIQRAGQQINAGDGLADSFQNLGLFPPLVVRMLRIGETTGALDQALLNINYFYTREVRDGMDRALKLLGPATVVILGLFMALIVFAVLSPIYDMLGKLPL